jgi:hypothetical protein
MSSAGDGLLFTSESVTEGQGRPPAAPGFLLRTGPVPALSQLTRPRTMDPRPEPVSSIL